MNATILLLSAKPFDISLSAGYIAGAVMALFIFLYLLYSLIKPDKF